MGDYTQRSGSLRENMKNMTPVEKLGYIWDLYKLPIVLSMAVVALAQYRGSGMIGPVEKVLTAEQLLAFSGKLLPVTAEDGSEYLGVVDITDTAFARDCISGGDKVYIAFPGNTVRADRLDTFLDWLLAWEG